MDRNFLGASRIKKLVKVTHVLIRLKSDITVKKIGDFLPDGSYLADVGGKDQKIRMRVIEYCVHVDGQDVPEMFCLVTDLDDWEQYPAGTLAAAYKWRWDRDDPPGARRLDHRHRTRPRCRPRSSPVRRPGPQGTPRRAGRGPPADLLHRSPPRRHHRDPQRHRDHKTKTRQAFPAAGRGITTRKAPAEITVCGPIAA
jgi:hypothetical protein